MKRLRIDFQVITAAGAVAYTTGDRDLAVAWVKERIGWMPGLTVDEVEILENRRRVYRPRPVLVMRGMASRDHALSVCAATTGTGALS